ncbi:hypothetical protein D9758_005060 [Tetrapyrgos nigripes]|uniref:Helicase ATP-binding domain-containing protein n=1 Tax=Tetrapyrgos nigripes TaxID=182062 RepID=A0A8H5GWA3_9AGAR|nr:hypothetical protein D9758_005060 [Tetrapyrgos nigripes]
MLHAQSKGLNALAINEDTEKTPELWEQLFTTAHIIYFHQRWLFQTRCAVKDPRIRRCLGAVFIDEAHCIDEWGENDLCLQYRQLSIIRPLCGYDVPFVACTATCRTSTFDIIWQVLRFGSRPFWGVDVGTDQSNLFFHTHVLKHTDNPVLDALHLLPNSITEPTQREEIDKLLFYFDSERGCRDAVDTL